MRLLPRALVRAEPGLLVHFGAGVPQRELRRSSRPSPACPPRRTGRSAGRWSRTGRSTARTSRRADSAGPAAASISNSYALAGRDRAVRSSRRPAWRRRRRATMPPLPASDFTRGSGLPVSASGSRPLPCVRLAAGEDRIGAAGVNHPEHRGRDERRGLAVGELEGFALRDVLDPDGELGGWRRAGRGLAAASTPPTASCSNSDMASPSGSGVSGAVAKFTPKRRHQMVTARYLSGRGRRGRRSSGRPRLPLSLPSSTKPAFFTVSLSAASARGDEIDADVRAVRRGEVGQAQHPAPAAQVVHGGGALGLVGHRVEPPGGQRGGAAASATSVAEAAATWRGSRSPSCSRTAARAGTDTSRWRPTTTSPVIQVRRFILRLLASGGDVRVA